MAATSTQFLPFNIDVGGSAYPAADGTSTTLPTYPSDSFSARHLMPSHAMTTTATAGRASLEVRYFHLDSPPLSVDSLQRHPRRSSHFGPTPLSIREYFTQRSPTLTRSLRKSLRAEGRVAHRQVQEMQALRLGLGYEESAERDDRQHASYLIGFARAVLETASAEKQLATSLVDEAEVYLRSTHDMMQVMDERLVLAEDQLGDILDKAQCEGLPTIDFSSSPRHSSPQGSDEAGSDADVSDTESYYDAPSGEDSPGPVLMGASSEG